MVFSRRVDACVQEAKALLCALHLPLDVTFIRGTGLMASCRSDVIAIPSWQVLRTFGPWRASFVRTLLHECGHAFWNRHRDYLVRAGACKIFGSDRFAYPDDRTLLRYRFGRRTAGFITSYARSHPLEDFAETFAYVVERRLKWSRVRDKVVRTKMQFMRQVLRDSICRCTRAG